MDAFGVPYHARSYSLPSRPNPVAQEFLCRLRSSEPTSTSSSSITHHLSGLRDLHDCVGELLRLPLTRQAISHASMDGLLDGSLRLLDACNIVKEALLQTKESAQDIQSVLRRRCDARAEVKNFVSARKEAKKAIQKGLKNLKCIRNKCSPVHETAAVLGEAQEHTLLALESLLEFINGKKASSRSFVSKVMQSKRVSSQEENEFAKADAAVQSLVGLKGSAEDAQNRLKELDLRIQDLQDGVESLFRSLIKTRVSLLNIINH